MVVKVGQELVDTFAISIESFDSYHWSDWSAGIQWNGSKIKL